ncbi:hypothetical protein SAMN05444171_4066 [Bradyrhizobium lablabi]|uniref:DUF3102 domain-containing protein n=3 Tax=Nitrobacteraceae TaxID=41294 RepID=A0ABY0PK06_9BRAD|nr:hypothetical protein SAMN05444163_3103 [Bradyrhizobium ottawaense]SED42286.1 hypothetical protein SAMN05444171_4066 [Bradyrhizobium lablabi]
MSAIPNTPDEHLAEAKELIARDEAGDRERTTEQRVLHMGAAEHIAKAMTLDNRLTQRKVADRIGKSPAWVNTLIAWRAKKYETPTAFGPQAKEAREKSRLDPTKHTKPKATTAEKVNASRAKHEAEAAKARAQEAKARQREAKAQADRARAEARKAREQAKETLCRIFHGGKTADISAEQREKMIKFLGMLGSEHDGERANAGKMADVLRTKLGVAWDQLIVEAAR